MRSVALKNRAYFWQQINTVVSGTGQKAPAEYAAFTVQQELWKRFGWTDQDLPTKPKRQVDEYIEFIRMIQYHEEAEHKRQQRKMNTG